MTIVTPSQWLADLVGISFLSKYPIKIIHNGINTNVFRPTAGSSLREIFKLSNKFIILGVASGWDLRKGLNYFLQLSKIICNDCVIILVGLDEKQIAALPSNIIGIKRTSNINELVQIYSLADVFVNPTVEDNFPTVNLESLACGTPVITFNTGGSPEAVDDKCGYVAELGNIYHIKKFIEIVRSNGKDNYSEHCIRRATANFSMNDCFDEYIELYSYLLYA
jgi:glycosyltransferase involved in cell wall biosynthesis